MPWSSLSGTCRIRLTRVGGHGVLSVVRRKYQTPWHGALSPWRYGPGADARSGGLCANRWCASPPVRGKLHQQSLLPSSALPPVSVCQTLSSRKTRWKSARLRVGWCCVSAQPLSGPLQTGLRLLHPPLPPRPSAHFTVCFPEWETCGLTTFRVRITDGLGPACLPVVTLSTVSEGSDAYAGPRAFWLKPVSVLGLLVLTTCRAVHICWPCHPTLAPDHLDAGSRPGASRFQDHPGGWGLHCPRSFARLDCSRRTSW